MSRNIIHKIQNQIFRIWSPFNFLNEKGVSNLVESLRYNIEQSGYCPDIIVGISSGGDYPAEELSKKLNTNFTKMQVSHYSLNLMGIKIDEIVGAYRIAKALGHKPKTELIKDVLPEEIEGKRVLIIDDDSYSGKTLDIAKESIKRKAPLDIRTGVLHTYQKNNIVDFAGKYFPKKEFYDLKFRFPWSKMSPYYEDQNMETSLDNLVLSQVPS